MHDAGLGELLGLNHVFHCRPRAFDVGQDVVELQSLLRLRRIELEGEFRRRKREELQDARVEQDVLRGKHRRRAHRANHREDLVLLDHLLRRQHRALRIVTAVFHDQLDLAAVDAAFGVDLVEIGRLRLADDAVGGRRSAVGHDAADLDFGVAWHYGDPHREQRLLIAGEASVDLSHWGVVTVTGVDRLSWLHSLTTAFLDNLGPNVSRIALILSPHGHVEQELHVTDDGETTWLITPPNTSEALITYLNSMRFMLRVDVTDVSEEFAVVWEPVHELDPNVTTWLTPRRVRRNRKCR